MIDIMSVLTSDATGLIFGAALVMMLTNLCKAGWFGAVSRWVNGVDDKMRYGRRVLTISVCLSCLINALQWAAIPESQNIWGCILRVIGCSLLASGGYEYVKTVSRPFAGRGGDDVGKS